MSFFIKIRGQNVKHCELSIQENMTIFSQKSLRIYWSSKDNLLEHLEPVRSVKTKRYWQYPLRQDKQITLINQIIPVNVVGACNMKGWNCIFELDNWHVIHEIFKGPSMIQRSDHIILQKYFHIVCGIIKDHSFAKIWTSIKKINLLILLKDDWFALLYFIQVVWMIFEIDWVGGYAHILTATYSFSIYNFFDILAFTCYMCNKWNLSSIFSKKYNLNIAETAFSNKLYDFFASFFQFYISEQLMYEKDFSQALEWQYLYEFYVMLIKHFKTTVGRNWRILPFRRQNWFKKWP